MPALLHVSINFSSALHPPHRCKCNTSFKFELPQPSNYYPHRTLKIESFRKGRFKSDALGDNLPLLGVGRGKDGILVSKGRRKRAVAVKFNNGFNGLGGGGGDGGGGDGGGRISGETARMLGNLGLAVLLTYLSMTGQLGWLLDAIVSIWLLAVLVPIVGIGAFLWWAGRDIVQSNCPNCGNEFQVFKSTLNDELQLCPFCSQPFSVEGNEFVSDPVMFSNQSTKFNQAYGDIPRKNKGKVSKGSVVDIEAEIRDAE
ncbi:hypothetical protein ABFX02_13G079800 [Erythranthe guttata]